MASNIEEAAEKYVVENPSQFANADLNDAKNRGKEVGFKAGVLSDAAKAHWFEQFKAQEQGFGLLIPANEAERTNVLLIGALRFLNDEQRIALRDALIERTPKVQEQKPVWVKADIKPEYNLGVLVFITDEDYHITSGMWDISNKWVLLDEYRVPECEVTHWMHLPEFPEGFERPTLPKEYIPALNKIAEEELPELMKRLSEQPPTVQPISDGLEADFKLLYKKINTLSIEVDGSIVSNIKETVNKIYNSLKPIGDAI